VPEEAAVTSFRIDRYLAAEILAPFITALAFLFMLLFAMQLLRGIDVMVGAGVRVFDLARIGGFLAPHFLVMAMPVAFLFAVMLGVGRWAEDRETVALAASGFSPWRFLLAPVVLALAVAGLGVALGYGPEPRGLADLKLHVNELIKRNMAGDVKPNTFYDTLNDITLYVQGVNPKTRKFQSVLLADERDLAAEAGSNSRRASMLVLAREGTVDPAGGGANLRMILEHGEIHRSATEGDDEYALVFFDKATFTIAVEGDLLRKNKFGMSKEELTPAELLEVAREREEAGDLRAAAAYELAHAKRLAGPLATLALALCGVPLAMGRRRKSRGVGAIATLAIYIGYYVIARSVDVTVEKLLVPPLLAAHVPNLVFAALGLVLVRRSVRAEA